MCVYIYTPHNREARGLVLHSLSIVRQSRTAALKYYAVGKKFKIFNGSVLTRETCVGPPVEMPFGDSAVVT
jgi:hypothetical protein